MYRSLPLPISSFRPPPAPAYSQHTAAAVVAVHPPARGAVCPAWPRSRAKSARRQYSANCRAGKSRPRPTARHHPAPNPTDNGRPARAATCAASSTAPSFSRAPPLHR
ncbi:hypothetical protein AMAG_20114 [Allomyces macrogynus ATCC 38327]|uniref:Uncharacterized protein n=1 Tax=Allomyces macrogynus (strain ATCC 38327) TaxID=578462 RepID=A0A0L0T6U7_ALLM3|nr:hypothetical protein AMAG_20114 [Allomyces macrogynus ATCC 38327]|eukprot:KNE70436.1 hypothetical protein AMAG_20114 [Allomyces macrogynus ATCC 38327]